MTQSTEILRQPGQVEIDHIYLVSFTKGSITNLKDYLVEIVIYESIFNPFLSGEILISDSRNLIREMNLIGEEFLQISIRTPTLSNDLSITKAFRIYSIDRKNYVKDGDTILYKMLFTSLETFVDLSNPIYKAFSGTPNEIVGNIFKEYLLLDRTLKGVGPDIPLTNSLTVYSESTNILKFVSPGWTAAQCINWIGSKAVPANNKAANYLFWESTKGSYFGSIGDAIQKQEESCIGTYNYSMPLVTNLSEEDRNKNLFMFSIRSLEVEKTFDQLKNLDAGYVSSRLIDIDLLTKSYENIDYDHGANFATYDHMQTGEAKPLFEQQVNRNPLSFREINYKHKSLHTGYTDNFDTKIKNIFGNRRSNLIELENFQMRLTIPGRTDIEVGRTMYINLPKHQPGALQSPVDYKPDELYSGYYLITSIAHKINLRTHFITMNVTKDSLPAEEFRR